MRKKEEQKQQKQPSDNRAELTTEEIFERIGFQCIRLDKPKRKPRKRCVDYLIYRKQNHYEFLCEVTSVLSGGYDVKQGHLSLSLEPSAIKPMDVTSAEPEPAHLAIPMEKLVKETHDALEKAISQRKGLLTQKPSYKKHPFVVALFFDVVPDIFEFIDSNLHEYAEVSAIVKKFKDCDLHAKMRELSLPELEDRVVAQVETGEQQFEPGAWDASHWHYLINKSAANPFDAEMVGVCPHDEIFRA